MKKILVLMATYNGENYLAQQLDSLFLQKNVDVTVLVRDDGSTDCTQFILEKYAKQEKLTWYQGTHVNVQRGFFELLVRASQTDFEYFALCDQDDVWDIDKIDIALKKLKGMTDKPALYYCGQRLVDKNLKFIANHTLNTERNLYTRFVLSDFAGCTGVFNKCLVDEVVKFEPEYMLMHDTWMLKVCLCLGGEVIVDTAVHMSYRQHGKNTVGLGKNILAYIKQVKQYIFEYQVERQIKELVRGYGDRMVPEYKKISQYICGYRTNKEYRKSLLDFNNINFGNRGLNLTYWIKVVLRKL